MSDLLHDPFVQSSLLPLLVSLLMVGVLHRLKRPLAVAGIAATFLVVFALVVGLPALPPPSSMGKLFWASAAGLALGVAADVIGARGRAAAVCLAAWLAGSLVWISLPALESVVEILTLLVLLAVGAWVAFGRHPGHSDGPTAPAASLLALALAVGSIALIGSSASIAQMALALAAAAGGFLLWNWPVERHAWGMSGQAALGIVVLLAGVLALFTQSQATVLLLALPALLADRVRRYLPVPATRFGQAAGAAAVTVAAVLPALVAIGAAYTLSGGEASPY
ncbi:hypothetical protein [Azospirillum sp. TSO35-2]|uniref:hypothetical protein n=1 Tax=Azospirillum sp. TSO35-2 TaxID=716796 RepID=UPI000D611AC0|nr:hypothetical protein [Azospirillum sp. TSO35-2]PWC31385.1 hypothetical protein TSO352_31970 [Azospirillum sp. TSO35-2]